MGDKEDRRDARGEGGRAICRVVRRWSENAEFALGMGHGGEEEEEEEDSLIREETVEAEGREAEDDETVVEGENVEKRVDGEFSENEEDEDGDDEAEDGLRYDCRFHVGLTGEAEMSS